MENILQRWRSFFLKKSDRLSEILYVPSQTGSHDVGAQYLGDVASSYLEHQISPRQVACHLEELNCQNGNGPRLEMTRRGQVNPQKVEAAN